MKKIFFMALLSILALSACATPASEETTVEETTEETVSEDTIVVTADEYSYTLSDVEVSPGEQVTMVVENAGAMMHDLKFEKLDVKTKMISPGERDTITFTAPTEPGQYVFYCTVGGHRNLGMEGKLIVENNE